jgi:Prophage CP4-57 regulatory protein (AlpA)
MRALTLRLRQVSQLTGLDRSMIYEMRAEGRLPQRINLGERAVEWPASVACQPQVGADQRLLTANLNDLVQAFASAEVRTLGNFLEWMGFRISGSPIE